MDGFEHSGDNEIGGPDHGSWLDKPLPGKTCETETEHLASDGQQKLIAPSKLLSVEDLLRQEHIG